MVEQWTERTRRVRRLAREATARSRHTPREVVPLLGSGRQEGRAAGWNWYPASGRRSWGALLRGVRSLMLLGLLLGVLSMPGCYDGEDTGELETTQAPPGQSVSAVAASFVVDVQPIFTRSCATVGCHNAVTQAAGLNLEAGVAFGNLVQVPSRQMPALRRIVPGDPENSYLFRKIAGTAGISGNRMPRNNPTFFDQNPALLALIRQWIEEGAEPLSVSFAEDVQPILTQSCAVVGCHNAVTQALGLNLEASVAFENIVEVPSRQMPTQHHITPGDAENSYLFRKIAGTAGISGNRMPRNNPTFFDQNPVLLTLIRHWIQEGALQ